MTYIPGGGGGGGVTDGDKGDIVVSGTGANWNFDSGVVTAFAKTVLDDVDAAAVRTTIGAQASGSYQASDATLTALAGASWSAGTQALTLTATDTITLKTVGSASGNILDKAAGDALYQPLDTDLTSLAGLTLSQGDILYRDGSQLQRLAAGTNRQFLQTQGAAANPQWAGAMVLISTQTPAGTTTATFSSIPSGFSALKVVGVGRTTTTSTGAEEFRMRFNGDTAANYGTQRQLATASTASALQATAQTYIQVGEASRTGDIANLPSMFEVIIPLYDQTTFAKPVLGWYMMFAGAAASSLYDVTQSGYWNSTAAITQIDVVLSAGNWVTGSKVMLYGLP